MVIVVGWLQTVIESGTDGTVTAEEWGVTATDDGTGAVVAVADIAGSEIPTWTGG